MGECHGLDTGVAGTGVGSDSAADEDEDPLGGLPVGKLKPAIRQSEQDYCPEPFDVLYAPIRVIR